MSRGRPRQRGAVALELVLLTPIFLILLDFAVLGGRLAESQSEVDAAAHAAARAASLQRTVAGADSAARTVAADTLRQPAGGCRSLEVQVETAAFRPGGVVVVTVRCDVPLSDLAWLPLPGTRTVEGTSTSAVDTYRSASP
ncbi:MAG: TadE/TadG family type IV pilus assembly protein [Solirubrobacteraceae bacterium]